MGDTLGHATVPGVATAFLIMLSLGHEPRTMWVLLTAALSAPYWQRS